ncbi:envelope stress sensor histidine kinase CpxA [Salinivibrio sp. ES.052]|uniref:envelope stress sensor histidine kinase CpxA n=1 Tax=Salinivibrio sp. ES.052 TaxID=1882823 RepID=UPI0009296560|nr:envelope stress sensor histidine kinase CpxA [Salinivibrio sp. ES.052]SIO18944.1 two-component system, OmpR family, sensor histidine kinase CpxA [Salinivibrio sp. ES.052]
MGRLGRSRQRIWQAMSRFPFFSRLYGRVFVIFWLTLLLVLAAVIWAQRGDPRSLHPVPISEQAHITDQLNPLVAIAAARDIPIATVVARHNQHRGHRHNRGKNTLYWVPKAARLDDFPSELRRFMSQTTEADKPMQRLVRRTMLAGPFPVMTEKEQGALYHARRWQPRLPFVLKILEKPQHLLIVTMLVSTPLLLWLAHTLTRPARRFEAASRRVASGELVTDPELERGPREFSEAGKGFNHMIRAVNQMVTGQQQLVSDISHELRSPLTRLQMARALAERELGQSDTLARIEREASQLEALIAELLTLSKLQAQGQLERASVSAESLWQPVVDDACFEANQQGKQVTVNTWPSAMLSVNVRLACSALDNVLRNAIRYADAHIVIDVQTDSNMLLICVCDDGPGVPESMLVDIFRPFYRVSAARDRQSGGTGLGLAITAQAVQQHGGQVVAQNRPTGGLVVTLRWPIS